MTRRDHTKLIRQLSEEYVQRFPRSCALHERAKKRLIDGGNHLVRLYPPFPLRYTAARGAYITDADGHQIMDFWQGHLANILGHNPAQITEPLAEAAHAGWGLQSGHPDELQIAVAEMLAERTGAERVRLTTSGSLATMYAIMLARAFTGRDVVLKIEGGWHGAQPWALFGISPQDGSYDHLESEGLPKSIGGETLVTPFNDANTLADIFKRQGDRIACLIMEPWLGSNCSIPAEPEFIRAARELTDRHGALLILDEVIAGFRFRCGNLGAMYGVQPDLTTLGKIIGGGMPLAAVVGRADVMALCGRANGSRRVRFDGGTYSAHPLTLLAAKTMLAYLAEHETEIYHRLGELGDKARRGIEVAFANYDIVARCTGYPNEATPGSSLGAVHFPYDPGQLLHSGKDVSDPTVCDTAMREQVLKLGLLLQDIHVSHGLGAISLAHTDADIERLIASCATVAERVARTVEPG